MGDVRNRLTSHMVLGIDTPVFIYAFEDSPRFGNAAIAVLKAVETGKVSGVTSVLTLLELAVRPLRLGLPDVADDYEVRITQFPNLAVEVIGLEAAHKAAELRARHGISPADALQIGTCLCAGATGFLTNDLRLRRLPEIEVLTLDDVA